MAYDRDDIRYRRSGRDRDAYGRDQFRGNDSRDWERGDRGEDRGFFERAGDEIASWFGGEDDSRNRDELGRREPWGGGQFERDRGRSPDRERGYRPMAGDYGRSEPISGRGGERQRSQRFSENPTQGMHDPHYRSWRQQQIDALDRDYDDYRRENQGRFESDFGGWRERRMSKRSLLGTVREQMEVLGNDEEHVGTVDRVVGDRIILAKSDPESGGVQYSLSCSDIDRIEENRVILDCDAAEAKKRWRDENRSRALFEREDQGEMGPRILDRSFEGTYR